MATSSAWTGFGETSTPGASSPKTSSTPAFVENDVLGIFRDNLEVCGWEKRVSILVGESTRMAGLVKERSLDALFFDGDHRYSSVKADLQAWLPRVKPGGLVFGHDYEVRLEVCDPERVAAMCEEDFVDGRHYGVIRAVSEAFPDVLQRGRIWYTRMK